MHRVLTGLALALLISAPVWAEGKTETHQGTVISVTGNQLHMRNANGTEYTHVLAPNAMVFCDGKVCKLGDLKSGMHIWVTTPADDLKTAVNVQAQSGNVAEVPREHRGKGYLGVAIQDLSAEQRGRLGIAPPRGAEIVDVMPNTPAAKAGLQNGDVVLSVDGREVDGTRGLKNAIQLAGAGHDVTLLVQRGQQTRELKAHLAGPR